MRSWWHKILALCPEHPKRDQNPKFTPPSETTSVCFIWESPPPGNKCAIVAKDSQERVRDRVPLHFSELFVKFMESCNARLTRWVCKIKVQRIPLRRVLYLRFMMFLVFSIVTELNNSITFFQRHHFTKWAQQTTSLETQGLLAGMMQYFWAEVYFKSWRAPGNLFLPNQFQRWSNSVPLIGQKNIFLPNQRWGLAR